VVLRTGNPPGLVAARLFLDGGEVVVFVSLPQTYVDILSHLCQIHFRFHV